MAEQKERTPLYVFARGVFGLLFRTLTVLFRKDSTEGFAKKENANERTRQGKRKKK